VRCWLRAFEAVSRDEISLGSSVGTRLFAADKTKRISGELALTILRASHVAGVDVLARGSADPQPVLHAAAAANASAVVHWLVTVSGALVEDRDGDGYTPLLCACAKLAWAAAHALLDCGARVDVQSTDGDGWWPVLMAVKCNHDTTLLRRILAADRDSLLRCADGGFSPLHMTAASNPDALQLLLVSGSPHLAEAINAVAIVSRPRHDSEEMQFTPLHCACVSAHWDAALALLAAGARVDIAAHVDGSKVQTMAEWARRSPACKHRGVKLAIAARAREHAAQAAAAAKGVPAGGAGSGAGVASAAAASCEAPTNRASGSSGSGSASDNETGKQQAKARKGKGRQGAARNRAEEAYDAVTASPAPPRAAEAAAALSPAAHGRKSSAPISSGCAESNPSEGGSTTTVAACVTGFSAALVPVHAPAAAALNLPEDPSAAPAGDTAAPLSVAEIPSQDSAAAASSNTREPGAATADSSNTCEPGAAADASSNTCEPGERTATEGAPADTACRPTSEPGTGVDSTAATAGATAIAALLSAATSAAAVRRHLAALSELARDPAAAAALASQGAIAAIGVAVSRHGAAVSRSAVVCLTALSAAAAEGGEAEDEEGEA